MTKFAAPRAILYFSFFVSLFISGQNALDLPFPISDPFHQGEFLAAAIAVLNDAPYDGDPLIVHGAVDILPALVVAQLATSQEFVLSYTLAIYPFISIITVIITLAAALRLADRFQVQTALLIPFILFVPFSVGWRDLFFSISLYMFAAIVPDERGRGGGPAKQIIFGLVIALGTYWSFNRGVAALVAFGPLTIWLAVHYRRFWISILTALAGFVFIGSVFPGISIQGYIENFLVLLETSSQWTFPPSLNQNVWTGLVIAVGVISAATAVVSIRKFSLTRSKIILLSALIIASAVYLKIGLGRVDQVHIQMAVWLPMLIITIIFSWEKHTVPNNALLIFSAVLLSVVITFVLRSHYVSLFSIFSILIIATGFFLGERGRHYLSYALLTLCLSATATGAGLAWLKFQDDRYAWLSDIAQLPAAENAVTEGVLWSSRKIVESGSSCVFDLVNNGLINAVTNLPPCSRFTYPVYANRTYESQLIDDLRSSDPALIVYSSDFWSYSIDGKPMTERFPLLDAEILDRYPNIECNFGYCVRIRDESLNLLDGLSRLQTH